MKDELRLNLTNDDVIKNLVEIALYLVQLDEPFDTIEMNINNMNIYFRAWIDEEKDEEKLV